MQHGTSLPAGQEQQPEKFTLGLLSDVFKVLAAHGYEQGKDNKVYSRSMTALLALTRAYEGEEL